MKVTVPMILIAVVCTSALILTGVAYSAEFTVDNNRIDTATVYCTLESGTSIDVKYSTTGEITFGDSPQCTVTYREHNGTGNALLAIDVTGTAELNGKILNIIQDRTVVGSSVFTSINGGYHADIRGFSIVKDGSFAFSAEIVSANSEDPISLVGGNLVFDITAYPIIGGQ